jgi:asparagine N-glycosylation enzyme membrane subunit Stt3
MTSAQNPTQHANSRKPWPYLVIIAGLTLSVIPVAGGFWTPLGPASHVQLPGVLMFVALAFTCVVIFMRCPSRPTGWKIAALVFALPSLYLAVDTVMMYLAFGLRR